ncbi:hypothetical protein LIER_04861 [Lithospermum erythrorhizon]|uniref:Reverse transcriptase domain-containing protein n=1 Tax=Lithospermum erythrorhizon TaxID=34254 RepID=A0AAV3NY94_LITER
MSQLRPINLCNIIAKIVYNVLANRLRPVLMSIISETQSAFLPGSIIYDNTLIAHEILHFLNTNRHMTGLSGVFWKLLCESWVFVILLLAGLCVWCRMFLTFFF